LLLNLSLQQKTDVNDAIWASVKDYDQKWRDLDETENFAQRHDVNMAKAKVRPDVEADIREQVRLMISTLAIDDILMIWVVVEH
jgi:IQ and AAA domain-containing protein